MTTHSIQISTYKKRLEDIYTPLTTKNMRSFSLIDFLLGSRRGLFYLGAPDEDIDRQSLENDAAVVAKDFIQALESTKKNVTKKA